MLLRRSRRRGEDRRAAQEAGRRLFRLKLSRRVCRKVKSRGLEGPGSGDPKSKARSDPAACEKKKGLERVPGGWAGARERTRLLVVVFEDP